MGSSIGLASTGMISWRRRAPSLRLSQHMASVAPAGDAARVGSRLSVTELLTCGFSVPAVVAVVRLPRKSWVLGPRGSSRRSLRSLSRGVSLMLVSMLVSC